MSTHLQMYLLCTTFYMLKEKKWESQDMSLEELEGIEWS